MTRNRGATDRPPSVEQEATLADRLALAIVEHGPSAGSTLAARIGVRKATVLRELRTNPRFEQLGRGRGSSWRLAGNRMDPAWEPLGTDSSGRAGSAQIGPNVLARLDAIEARLAALEQRAVEDPRSSHPAESTVSGEDRPPPDGRFELDSEASTT